jgi:uncharacterized protein YkwD
MKKILHHLFIPHPGNNFRAKLLHHKSLLFLTLFLFITSLFLIQLQPQHGQVLGISINVTAQDLLTQTNAVRQEQGLPPLKLNSELSKAASLKALYMFSKNYWAHNAPDGTTPWIFIRQAGYNYIYAGENLARGFTSTNDVIKAWMASPSHRENVLSPNYEDIGFAIEQGKLTGEDTTLIVEMFGNTTSNTFTKGLEKVDQMPATSSNPTVGGAAIESDPLISLDSFTKNFGIMMLVVFIAALLLDMLVVQRKQIGRVVGHNMDHIFFFAAIGLLVLILARGVIL